MCVISTMSWVEGGQELLHTRRHNLYKQWVAYADGVKVRLQHAAAGRGLLDLRNEAGLAGALRGSLQRTDEVARWGRVLHHQAELLD